MGEYGLDQYLEHCERSRERYMQRKNRASSRVSVSENSFEQRIMRECIHKQIHSMPQKAFRDFEAQFNSRKLSEFGVGDA